MFDNLSLHRLKSSDLIKTKEPREQYYYQKKIKKSRQ